jgi:hypothetical protein
VTQVNSTVTLSVETWRTARPAKEQPEGPLEAARIVEGEVGNGVDRRVEDAGT